MLFSEPKIPQLRVRVYRLINVDRFSALQRAENSSIEDAAREFRYVLTSFSALQRAENSSMDIMLFPYRVGTKVSVLFSEPKIPQLNSENFSSLNSIDVSVLFSEPKIPQFPTLAPASIHISDRDDHASSFLSLPGASP